MASGATQTMNGLGSSDPGSHLSFKDKQKLKRKDRKKKKNENKKAKLTDGQTPSGIVKQEPDASSVVIEYVAANPLDDIERDDPTYSELSEILSKFGAPADMFDAKEDADAMDTAPTDAANGATGEDGQGSKDEDDDGDSKGGKKLSKRQKRLARRLDIAVLKQLVKRPELVDACDPASSDPFLLVHLKSQRNSVPIPRHWQQRRKYLQVRGSFSVPFLP
jgi:splicing factor 3B subunit 2